MVFFFSLLFFLVIFAIHSRGRSFNEIVLDSLLAGSLALTRICCKRFRIALERNKDFIVECGCGRLDSKIIEHFIFIVFNRPIAR